MSDNAKKADEARKSAGPEIPRVEWIAGAIGLVIVLLAVGVLIFEAIAGDHSPPDIKLTVQAITPLRNGFLVRVHAENQGGEPAARVPITAELLAGEKVVEESATQFEYVPAHSGREAGVFFTRDPRQGAIRLRAQGFEEP